MAPESQCISREEVGVTSRSFVTRVMALPAVDEAATIYRITKEQQPYVGVALRLAEAGIMKTVAATGVVMPLATPIANRFVGGWGVLDEWACQWLDNAVEAVPIIAKPSDEIVHDTHQFVMKSLAGPQHANKQLTLGTALAARATDVVDHVSTTNYGKAVIEATDALLLSAHRAVDTYLPPVEGDLHHADGSEGSLSTKAFTLAHKTHERIRRSTKHMLQHDDETNEDDIVIYPIHLMGNEDSKSSRLFSMISNLPGMKPVSEVAIVAMSLMAKNAGSLYKLTWEAGENVNTMLVECASNVYSLTILRGIEVSKHFASNGIQLQRVLLSKTIEFINDGMQAARKASGIAFTTAKATPSNLAKTSTAVLETIIKTATNVSEGAKKYNLALSQVMQNGKLTEQAQNMITDATNTIYQLKENGINTVAAAQLYCTEHLESALQVIPPSVYTKGHILYAQFLLTCWTLLRYPTKVLQNSSQMLVNVSQIPQESFVWLSKTNIVVQSQMLSIQMQIFSSFKSIQPCNV